MKGKLTAVSGGGAKGPACFLLEAEGRRLLFDLGYGPQPGLWPDVSSVGKVDALLLSHAHRDHAGGLKLLPDVGKPPLYLSEPLAHLLKEHAIGGIFPLNGASQVEGWTVTTGRNGHAPGGVWIHVATCGGVLYMGDCSRESLIYAYDPPPPARVVIVDASYASYESTLADCAQALEARCAGRDVLLPVPPGGRAPEIALNFTRKGVVPALDDAVRQATAWLAAEHGESALPEVRGELARIARDAPAIAGRGIMLAAPADGTAGVTARLIAEYEHASGPDIVFTGYLPPGTPAERLTKSGRATYIRWNVHPRLSDNVALARSVSAEIVVPAFGAPKVAAEWQEAFAPARVVLSRTVEL
ncbi:MAG TPA: MBL fold metallo-hydrolase [Burkholderiales bacterium]|jgi:Cft2 family RNA processing exonuclease|nr:MBL fold metallo-hydrolase [Burkholderiales bacterium]